MDELKKHPLLIALLVILAISNFILLPIMDWQDEMVSEISLKQKRLNKTTTLLKAYPQNQQQLEHLESLLTKVDQQYFPQQAENTFKLQQQTWLETIIESNQLNLQSLGWGRTKILEKTATTAFQVDIRLQGQARAFIDLHRIIENQGLKISVDEFRLNIKHSSESTLGSFQGNLKLSFYMLAGETE